MTTRCYVLSVKLNVINEWKKGINVLMPNAFHHSQQIQWLIVCLAILTFALLTTIYLLWEPPKNSKLGDLIINFIPSALVALVAIPIVYFIFTKQDIKLNPQINDKELVDKIRNSPSDIEKSYIPQIDKMKLHQFSQKRLYATEGDWVGEFYQPEGPDKQPLRISIKVTINAQDKKYTGTTKYTYNDEKTELDIVGTAMDQNHIRFDYFDSKGHIIRYGSVLLRLSDDAKQLNGHFVAYAAEMQETVTGRVSLKKKYR
ncbi:hypothetical protein GMMP1_730030 [Candidatus Magnetomoraceae bacterium gMMP-1]